MNSLLFLFKVWFILFVNKLLANYSIDSDRIIENNSYEIFLVTYVLSKIYFHISRPYNVTSVT